MSILFKKFIQFPTICTNFNHPTYLLYIGSRKLSLSSALCKEIDQNSQMSLHVAVIGVPNAGKSTFINNLIHHRVCPTSTKVHTTRKSNKAIFTTGNTQLVFYDTPGLVTQKEINKHNLDQSFKSAYRDAVQRADIIGVVHDISNSWTRNELHPTVLDTLKAFPSYPSFLILNKIDALKSKRVLLDLVKKLTNDTLSGKKKSPKKDDKNREFVAPVTDLKTKQAGWSNFSDVFMVSSIIGDGLNEILSYLARNAKPSPWKYSSDVFTDQPPVDLIVESVRARLLDYLPQEIPYNLKSQMEYYSEEKNTIYASVQVICPTARIERLICGEANGKLKQITERVTSDLVETFNKPISLTISTVTAKEATQRLA
ncbi:GTPase Era, mitochondrial [Episyrphus balteatus]|uniref:GTPase Era, mitochondrial n=1 Tax=Episyrphus balteatus TaxID=286459 RepID=UPI002485BBBD|nr:GTPase Era, mitochondrial [Episyrphus balteatus]